MPGEAGATTGAAAFDMLDVVGCTVLQEPGEIGSVVGFGCTLLTAGRVGDISGTDRLLEALRALAFVFISTFKDATIAPGPGM